MLFINTVQNHNSMILIDEANNFLQNYFMSKTWKWSKIDLYPSLFTKTIQYFKVYKKIIRVFMINRNVKIKLPYTSQLDLNKYRGSQEGLSVPNFKY